MMLMYIKPDKSRSSMRISHKAKEALKYLSGKNGCCVNGYIRNVWIEFEKNPTDNFSGYLRDYMLCELLNEVRK